MRVVAKWWNGLEEEEINTIRKLRPIDDRGTEESSAQRTLGLKEIITNYEKAIRTEFSVYDKGEKRTIYKKNQARWRT